MQNGMNPPRIAARLGAERVIGAFVNFGADFLGPAHVEYEGVGSLYLGEMDGRITERLRNPGVCFLDSRPSTSPTTSMATCGPNRSTPACCSPRR